MAVSADVPLLDFMPMAAPQYGTSTKSTPKWTFPLSKRHFLGIGLGVAVILVGFALLSTGLGDKWDNPLAVSVAPVVLVIGYCVIIPLAIIFGGSKDGNSEA